jgi:hypothetical protein
MPRFKLSPELLKKLRSWSQKSTQRDDIVLREDAFVLFGGMGSPMYLTADGRVLVDPVWEHLGDPGWEQREDLREATEDEAIGALVIGAQDSGITELLDLIPKRPGAARDCPTCSGQRWATYGGMRLICFTCHGRGWVA